MVELNEDSDSSPNGTHLNGTINLRIAEFTVVIDPDDNGEFRMVYIYDLNGNCMAAFNDLLIGIGYLFSVMVTPKSLN